MKNKIIAELQKLNIAVEDNKIKRSDIAAALQKIATANEDEKKPIKRKVTIKLTLKEAAKALGYDDWAKTNPYLDADDYDDVYHEGYSAKQISDIDPTEPAGLEGVNALFPHEVARALEYSERQAIASAVSKERHDAICEAFEKISPTGEYQSSDGEMISVRGCSISCNLDVPKDEVTLEIENPEHLINDIVAGVGMYYPPFDPYEEASEAEIKSQIISNIDGYFEVYGERKPTGELDSRYLPDVKKEDYEDILRDGLGNLTVDDIAECVVDAVDKERIEDEKEAIELAAKLTKENKAEIAKKVKELHKQTAQKYEKRAEQITSQTIVAELEKLGIEVQDGKIKKSDIKVALSSLLKN